MNFFRGEIKDKGGRKVIEINGVDLRDTDFVEVEEPDPKNKQGGTRIVKRELHDWIRKNIIATWSKEAVFTAYRKFSDVVQLAENKAKEGVTFIIAEETAEEKFRRVIGELKELESEVPPHLLRAILEENGYTFYTAPQDTEALRNLDHRVATGQAAVPTPPAAETQEAQATPPPPQQAAATAPAPRTAPPVSDPVANTAQNIAQIMRQRVPLNQQPVPIPEMPKAPVVIPESALPQQPAAVRQAPPASKIPMEAAQLDDLRSAPPQAVLPPGMAPPSDALPGTFGERPAAPVLAQKGQHHTDPRGLASILEQRPTSGINPKFRPPTR